jgi:hypothetical protein
MGVMLMAVIVMAFLGVIFAMLLEAYYIYYRHCAARHAAMRFRSLPTEDPPADSDSFYLIQIPVQKSNMGESFTPRLPEHLKLLRVDQKLQVVHLLTDVNEAIIDAFFKRLHLDWSVPLQVVTKTHHVSNGKIHLKHSRKTAESIRAKATRPSILAASPHFSVEHVRDTFRFKGVVHSFRDALHFIVAIDKDAEICPHGLNAESVAKLDVQKLKKPKGERVATAPNNSGRCSSRTNCACAVFWLLSVPFPSVLQDGVGDSWHLIS